MSDTLGVSMPSRPQNRVYRSIFRAHNSAPYVCYFCSSVMEELEHVHHLDVDPWNNAPENLVSAHAFCHNSAHHLGWRHTEETRQRIAETVRQYVESLTTQERSRKFGRTGEDNPFYGRTHTHETREKIRRAAVGRPGPRTVHTEETRRHLSEKISALPRRWCEECQRDWSPSHWGRHLRKYHEGGTW